jgi:tetratricopeptide (TPR) repeat protein
MGYYGRVLSITNRNEPAISMLTEAAVLGERYAGAGSPVAIQNRLFLGEAELSIGDRQRAGMTLTAAHDIALAQYGPTHPLTLRTELALGQWAAAGGHPDEARVQLQVVAEGLRKLGPRGESNLAEALEALGDTEAGLGHLGEASADLEEAVAIRKKSPDDLWELAQARERLGETLRKAGNPAATDLLEKAARDLESQLGADHPQTLRAKSALAGLS